MRAVFLFSVWIMATASQGATHLDSLWVQPYGAGSGCRADAIRSTADHGYVMVGTETTPSGDEVRTVRLDSSGQVLWTREYCGSWSLKAHDVRQAMNGDFLIAGTAASLTADSERSFLVRTNDQGDTLRMRIFGKASCGIHAVQPAADGGCVLAGWAADSASGESEISLVKADARGDIVWSRTYERSGEEWAAALQETADGDWIIAGQGMREDGVEMLRIIRTDSAGGLRWSKSFPMRGLLRVYGLERTLTGGFIIAGLRNPPGMDPCGFFLLKMDVAGNPLWLRMSRSECDPSARVMLRVTPSGFLLATYRVSLGSGPREMEILETDEDGELRSRQRYGGMGFRQRVNPHFYWEIDAASPFADGMYDFFVDPHPPIEESISIRPPAPKPEKSERHGPHDSFGNVYWADFALSHRQTVKVSIYDTRGLLIRTIADAEYCAGFHYEIFDGWSLPPGIYFLRVETANLHETKKVVLVH